MARHLISEKDRDEINEYLSHRASADASRGTFFSVLGALLAIFGIIGGVMDFVSPKTGFVMAAIGGLLCWLSSLGSVHLNNPNELK